MDNWEIFYENILPPKEAFHSNLNLEDISDEDYTHTQKVWDVFKINNIGDIMTYMLKVTDYCLLMYMKTLEICAFKNINLIPHILCLCLD